MRDRDCQGCPACVIIEGECYPVSNHSRRAAKIKHNDQLWRHISPNLVSPESRGSRIVFGCVCCDLVGPMMLRKERRSHSEGKSESTSNTGGKPSAEIHVSWLCSSVAGSFVLTLGTTAGAVSRALPLASKVGMLLLFLWRCLSAEDRSLACFLTNSMSASDGGRR